MAFQMPSVGWLISYRRIRRTALAYRRFTRRSFLGGVLLGNRWLLILVLLLAPMAVAGIELTHRAKMDYYLLTGPKGGTYDVVAPRLAEVLNRPDKLERFLHLNIVPDFTFRETCGSLENLFYIDHGMGQLAFAEDGLPLHFTRTSECKLPIGSEPVAEKGMHKEIRMRALMPLYKSPLHIVARKSLGIADADDIPPRTRTYLGPEGSATAFLAHLVLDHYGIAVERVGEDLDYEQAAQQMKEGKIDVGFFLSGLKAGVGSVLARHEGEFHLLRVQHAQGLTMLHPFLVEVRIPGAAFQDASQEISTIGTNTILVASTDLSDLEAYEIAAKIDRNVQDILQGIPLNYAKLADMDPRKGLYYTLHEGAVRFYDHDPPFFMDPRTLAGIGTYLSLLFAIFTLSSQFVRDYLVHRFLYSVDRAVKAFKVMPNQPASKRYHHYIHRLKYRALTLLKDEQIRLEDYKRIDEYIKGHS